MEKERKLLHERGMVVVKDNDLIQKAKFNLTANEQKLICYAISKIKPTDKDFQYYYINVSDFCYLCGIDKNHFYNEFKNLAESIDNKAIWIETKEKIFKFRWFLKIVYLRKEGRIKLLFDDDMKRYLLGLEKKFTQYELYNILALRGKYSIRLYELFKSYEYQKNISISIDILKENLFAENYKNFNDFKKRVLDKAIEEINNYTDLKVKYNTIKSGKRISTIIFDIQKKEMYESMMSYRKTIDEINRANKQIKGQLSIYDI